MSDPLQVSVLDERERGSLTSWENDELRSRRAACEEQEAAVSYARRVLQGRLDIVRAELQRREDEGDESAGALLAALPGLLAGDHVPTEPARTRVSSVTVPPAADELVGRIDADLGEVTLSGLGGRDEAELRDLIATLERHEQELSTARRALFDSIDALRDELAARYKDGRANVGDLLT